MKAILIDPHTETLMEVEVDGGAEICAWLDCRLFDIVYANCDGDGIYVDDEGLFLDDQRFFVFNLKNGRPRIVAGRGLALGCDTATGESKDVYWGLDEWYGRVSFVSRKEAIEICREFSL